MKKISSRRIAEHTEKWCHGCGESVKVYTIQDNAPWCSDCKPIERKKIPSEAKMLQKILKIEGEK